MSDTQETKSDKFIRLSTMRLQKVLDGLRILANTTNVRDYDYTPDQACEIVDTLYDNIDELSTSFGVPPRGKMVAQAAVEADGIQADETPVADPIVTAPKTAPSASGPIDEHGPKSRIVEIDGEKLRVGPGEWSSLELLRAGPHLGLAMEAVMDGNNDKALEYLKKVMIA
ncbi:hypothetical protein ACGYLO_17990 [Sulfitobacter sp. 1A13353]|uniref:hypothetical protein n=1 Tax=Sulfitobacter sp. 1A13353 TaxID=3368568 RepID=UPI003744B4BE